MSSFTESFINWLFDGLIIQYEPVVESVVELVESTEPVVLSEDVVKDHRTGKLVDRCEILTKKGDRCKMVASVFGDIKRCYRHKSCTSKDELVATDSVERCLGIRVNGVQCNRMIIGGYCHLHKHEKK